MLATLGEYDAKRARRDLGVLEEQLVEVAHPIEQQAIGIGGFDLDVLLHHRRGAPRALRGRTGLETWWCHGTGNIHGAATLAEDAGRFMGDSWGWVENPKART